MLCLVAADSSAAQVVDVRTSANVLRDERVRNQQAEPCCIDKHAM